MTRDDIIRMAREANRYASHQTGDSYEWHEIRDERFAYLVAAAEARHQQETLMLQKASYEREIEIEVAAERKACADICDQHASIEGIAQRCAAQIRARNKT